MDHRGIINFNIGLLGHVDSGKTTLARALSKVASTAAFDKSPQSVERGITLDLGFSALTMEAPVQVASEDPHVKQIQYTFVDCPGHSSLIRTMIGGAQIIDMMILVIDALKGIQTQTAECIVIGELLCHKLIIAVNKVDMLEEIARESKLRKLNTNVKKTLARTKFGPNVPMYNIAANCGIGIQELLDGICANVYLPKRNIRLPLLFYVDHCFFVSGQGTVCTGTVIQGKVKVNDILEIPVMHEQRKVKSIQMFRCPVKVAEAGDRVGLCVTQFNPKHMERGLIAQPGYLKPTYAACICLNRIPYYKREIKSGSKFHISIGHDTVMAKITLFKKSADVSDAEIDSIFSIEEEYEFVDKIETGVDEGNSQLFALLEFDAKILTRDNATLIASKLDIDSHTSTCRLAFYGTIQWSTQLNNYTERCFVLPKIFKRKFKKGSVQRILNDTQVIVQNMFTKGGNRDAFIGKSVELSTGEIGVIESAFGQGSKVKVRFINGIKADTMSLLRSDKINEVVVQLNFKRFIFVK